MSKWISKCKDPASCSRARKGKPTRTETSGYQLPWTGMESFMEQLAFYLLNMDIRKDLQGCTPFGMLFYIATIKRMSTRSRKQWGRGRQRAELAEGHSVSVSRHNPEGPEGGMEEPFYWQTSGDFKTHDIAMSGRALREKWARAMSKKGWTS